MTSGAQLQDPDLDHLNHHQNMHLRLLPLEMMIWLMARPTLTVTKQLIRIRRMSKEEMKGALRMTLMNMHSDAQSAQPQGSMWADCNPGKPVQPCRKRTRRPQTTTEKKTAQVRSEMMAKNADALGLEIKAFYSFQDKFIQQLVQKYKRKEPDI
ncbi:hypothetical protein AX14_002576 [Amanita brunnescens Koide BX004]|nr:hypothetical protein AX14_002576 [Amanita brunnescens Koide BX004]